MPFLDSAARVANDVVGPTTTIHFCGLGGSTEGALRAKLRPLHAVNHSAEVLDVHEENFPTVVTDCSDLAHVHPSRYRSSEVYQASPACTAHSAAAGSRKKMRKQQADLFEETNTVIDPSVEYAERSRATMFCVVDHAEYHRFPIVLVENVVDVARWILFPSFIDSMRRLGYHQQHLLSINAAFIGGTPQDRNRLHMAFAHRDAEMPNMNIHPPAPCPTCHEDVPAVQVFKPGATLAEGYTVGEYGAQYLYRCPGCWNAVVPYFRSALNIIDPTVEARTIGEIMEEKARRGQSFESMLIRIQKGIEQFGGLTPMLLTNNCTTHNGRTRSLYDVAFTQTGSNTTAVLLPPLDCGEADLPEATFCNAEDPRSFKTGIRGTLRSHSAIIDPERMNFARQLAAGSAAAADDLVSWRYRTLTPAERLQIQGFSATHRVGGTSKGVHLMIGNANPPTVEAELAARAGAALRPDLYPADLRAAA